MTRSLYKYMHRRYALRMLSEGEVRLGTLYDFRDEERLGSEIGDRDEGAITLKQSGFSDIDTASPTGVPWFLGSGISIRDGARLRIIARDGISRRHEDPDCWVYCTTTQFDVKQMKRFGYDTCIEIAQAEEFFFALSRKLRHKAAVFWGAATCVYRDRDIEHTQHDAIPPAFIKAPRFASQNEARALWFPKQGQVLAPITIRAKKATRFCRRIA